MTSLQQLSIIKEDMKSEAYLEVKYSNLEDWDSVLRTKLMARRLAALEEEDDDE